MLTSRNLVFLRTVLAASDSAVDAVKTLYDRDNFLLNSLMLQDLPKTAPMDAIKRLFKIHEVDIKLSQLVCSLLAAVSES